MVGLLRYKTAHKCSLSAPFRRPGVGRNPGVVGRFVAITALLPTPVRVPPRSLSHCQRDLLQEAIGFYVGGECCEVHMGSVWKDQRYGTDFERAGDARSLIN